jgi:small-conductance mechanosensitive channel
VILGVGEFSDQFRIKHEFIKRLHKRYRDEGIRIPAPTRTVALQQGSVAIPQQRIPEDEPGEVPSTRLD